MADPNMPYLAACHAVQTGVAYSIEKDPMYAEFSPEFKRIVKHLRVGIDSSKADHGALVRLLVSRGLFTGAEYLEAIRQGMVAEVDMLEQYLATQYGVKIALG